MVEGKKRMTAKRKLEVYLGTRQKDANVGEILRRYGLHLNDLRRIESLMERAALDALRGRPRGEQGAALNGKESAELVAELAQKEKALA